MSLESSKPEVLNLRYLLALDALHSTRYLNDSEKATAKLRLAGNHARTLLSWGRRNRNPLKAMRLMARARLLPRDVLLGLLGYR